MTADDLDPSFHLWTAAWIPDDIEDRPWEEGPRPQCRVGSALFGDGRVSGRGSGLAEAAEAVDRVDRSVGRQVVGEFVDRVVLACERPSVSAGPMRSVRPVVP